MKKGREKRRDRTKERYERINKKSNGGEIKGERK